MVVADEDTMLDTASEAGNHLRLCDLGCCLLEQNQMLLESFDELVINACVNLMTLTQKSAALSRLIGRQGVMESSRSTRALLTELPAENISLGRTSTNTAMLAKLVDACSEGTDHVGSVVHEPLLQIDGRSSIHDLGLSLIDLRCSLSSSRYQCEYEGCPGT